MKGELSPATRGEADGMAALASGFVAFEGAVSVVLAPRTGHRCQRGEYGAP